MSEISILSNQYKKLVDTSDKVNNSVIAFKKRNLLNERGARQKHPKLSITPGEIETAKEILVPFLTNLKQILEESKKDSEYIPSVVLSDYKKKLESKPYFKEELGTLIELLIKNQKITTEAISILDDIMSLLDSERSMLFRKLRTARG